MIDKKEKSSFNSTHRNFESIINLKHKKNQDSCHNLSKRLKVKKQTKSVDSLPSNDKNINRNIKEKIDCLNP